MSFTHNNWTKEDFIAYTLLYCANADFVEMKVELDFIKSKIETTNFDKLKEEFSKDNDYASIQKINTYIKEHNLSKTEKEKLIDDIKSLFMSDGEFDTLEHNMMLGLNKIIY